VTDAAYNSNARDEASGCLPGTRTELLEMIHNWIAAEGTLIFWLSGLAGTGKTSVAHSIAEAYDREPSRVASFFFSRDQQARSQMHLLFQTIAFQLGNAYPALKLELSNVLEDETILTSKLNVQFKKLILQPISKLRDLFPSPIVVVLDALDECAKEAHDIEHPVSRIITLLVTELKDRKLPLKFFITSRPELHIRSRFESRLAESRTSPYALHDVDPPLVRRDIELFLDHEFRRIADGNIYLAKTATWPSAAERAALANIAAGLFISAATAIRFVADTDSSLGPQDRLAVILASEKGAHEGPDPFRYLDIMYNQILESAISGIAEKQIPGALEQFRISVGMIVLAYGRLPAGELASLCAIPEGDVTFVLSRLHSVILVPKDCQPVRAFHLSFHDYITDNNRCTSKQFYINPSLQHAKIARFCLIRMTCSLKRDICGICDSTKLKKDVDDLDLRVVEHLPGSLRYSCQYWALHLSECSLVETLVELTHKFLTKYVLYWIEALSLIGELAGGVKSLRAASRKIAVRSALFISHRTWLIMFNVLKAIEKPPRWSA
jgi:NACHT domain